MEADLEQLIGRLILLKVSQSSDVMLWSVAALDDEASYGKHYVSHTFHHDEIMMIVCIAKHTYMSESDNTHIHLVIATGNPALPQISIIVAHELRELLPLLKSKPLEAGWGTGAVWEIL